MNSRVSIQDRSPFFVLKTGHFIYQIGPGGSADPSDPPLDPLLLKAIYNNLFNYLFCRFIDENANLTQLPTVGLYYLTNPMSFSCRHHHNIQQRCRNRHDIRRIHKYHPRHCRRLSFSSFAFFLWDSVIWHSLCTQVISEGPPFRTSALSNGFYWSTCCRHSSSSAQL